MAESSPFIYNSQLDAFTLYHVTQETSSSSSSSTAGPALPALGHALSGAVATAGSKLLLYPLDLVVTRLQVQRHLRRKDETASAARDADAEYTSLFDAASKIYRTEGGIRAFYTGCAPDVVKGVADSFLFFLGYTLLRQYEGRKLAATGEPLSAGKELRIGVMAGAVAKAVTTPIQNLVTRQQTAALVAARDPSASLLPGHSGRLSIRDVASQIREESGIKGFWAGYHASVVLTLNPALTFMVDNLLRRVLCRAKREKGVGTGWTFLIAAVSKAVATSITYPVMLAKSRAQAAQPDHGDRKKEGSSATPRDKTAQERLFRLLDLLQVRYEIFLSLSRIYRSEGLTGLYSGLEGEVLKGFLQHGLTMMMKERVHFAVVQIYYLMLKLTRRWDDKVKEAAEGVKGGLEEVAARGGNIGGTVMEGVKNAVASSDGPQ